MNDYIRLPRSALDMLPSATLKGIYLSMLERADENGQLIISVRRFADEIDVSYQTLRTAMAKMIKNAIINAIPTQSATRPLTQITLYESACMNKPNRNVQRESQRNTNAMDNATAEQVETPRQDGYDRFVEYFNKGFEGTAVPKVTKLTERRKTALRGIFKEYGKEKVEEALHKVYASDFLSGRETKWRATFDWIFNRTNFQKILEDHYVNRTDQTQQCAGRSGQGRGQSASLEGIAAEIYRLNHA